MKGQTINTVVLYVIAIVSIFLLVNSFTPNKEIKVQQINTERLDIVRLDSLLDAHERKILDSMHIVINKLERQDSRLTDFNYKMKKQNEKLDRIYSGIDVTRPDW
jgi:hypothetical protein